MGDITLPPLSSAVPMRRGAVSGASTGPHLPFPPMRLPNSEEELPSRGPSPTLGRRSSFTMGHSKHVPPGPDAHLPIPMLSGVAERRGAIAGPAQSACPPGRDTQQYTSEISRAGAIRVQSEGMAYYYGNTSSAPRAPPWQADSNMKSPSTSAYYAMQHPNDDSYYSYTPPGSIVASHTEQRHHAMYDHNSGQPMEVASIAQEGQIPLSGKRPRSAPRVLSSQPRVFACSQCPARFARNHDLKRHQRGHLSVRPYPCAWCGKSFSRKDALKRHILVKVIVQTMSERYN